MSDRRSFIKKATLAGIVTALSPQLLTASNAITLKQNAKKRSLRIAHITDVHLLKQANAEKSFANVLKEINAHEDKPALIINTGDTVMEENKQTLENVQAMWEVWNRIVTSENKIPIKSALGNHDVWYGPTAALDAEYKNDKRYGKQWAIDVLKLPNRYYAFDMNGWHFIALDSINGKNGYQLDDEQVNWLKSKLKEIPATSPICVFSHVPILSMGALLYSTKREPIEKVKFPSGDMHNDHQLIKDIFQAHKNVKLCLSGHVHYIDAIQYLGVTYLCNGAVSGNWWGNPLTLDEFPPVYTLVDLYEDGSITYNHIYYSATI
ncbi:MAG: metallophosphoesterase [Cyclobacteriaceae bacterium]|nr:metallophosphoesterase [Cyclobacteriaceae bacterium]